MSTRVLESHGFKMQAKGTVMNQKLMTKKGFKSDGHRNRDVQTVLRYYWTTVSAKGVDHLL